MTHHSPTQGVGAAVAGDFLEGGLGFNLDLFASSTTGHNDDESAAAAAAAAAALERAEAAEIRNRMLEEEVICDDLPGISRRVRSIHVTRHTSHQNVLL